MSFRIYEAIWMIEKEEQTKTYRLCLKIQLGGKNHDIRFHPKVVKGLHERMMVLEKQGYEPIEE